MSDSIQKNVESVLLAASGKAFFVLVLSTLVSIIEECGALLMPTLKALWRIVSKEEGTDLVLRP